MSQKIKVLISVVTAVVLLTVGSVATVMAQDGEEPAEEAETKSFLERVADNLGVTEEQLIEALKEAGRDLGEEAITGILDKLQENGLIEEDELAALEEWLAQRPDPQDCDAMKEWLEDRPEISGPGTLRFFFRGPGNITPHFGFGGGCALSGDILEKVADILGKTVEEVEAAFQQAREEMSDDAFFEALEKAVEQERILQQEANEIWEWWQNRPDALDEA